MKLLNYVTHTCPGCTVPIVGDIAIGDPSGTINSKDVGPTGNTGPLPTLGTACVNSLELRCELITKMLAVDVSLMAVALNLINDSDSCNGGKTPMALHASLNSLPMPDLQSSSKL